MNQMYFPVWMVKWIKSYLEDRKQTLVVRTSTLLERKIKCGVSQDSALGPLLFLICVSNMKEFITNCMLITYAADTIMLFKPYTVDGLFAIMEITFAELSSYMRMNHISLNISKTN